MKQELELLRRGRTESAPPDKLFGDGPTARHRKAIRETSDDLIENGLRANSIPALALRAARLLIEVARVADSTGVEPDVPDLIEGVTVLIEGARGVIDKGLLMQDAANTNAGAIMIEITVHGLCSVLALDYDRILPMVFNADTEGFAAYMKEKGYTNE